MITEELLSYIKKQLESGLSEATIKKILLDHKWKQVDIDQAFSTVLGARPQMVNMQTASIVRPQVSPVSSPQTNLGFQDLSVERLVDKSNIQTNTNLNNGFENFGNLGQNEEKISELEKQTSYLERLKQSLKNQDPKNREVKNPAFFYPQNISKNEILEKPSNANTDSVSAGSDFYSSLTQNTPSVFNDSEKAINQETKSLKEENVLGTKESPQIDQRKIDFQKPVAYHPEFENVQNKEMEVKEDTYQTTAQASYSNNNYSKEAENKIKSQNQEGRIPGQSFLRPKVWNPQGGNTSVFSGLPKNNPNEFGKFATPSAEEFMPNLTPKTSPYPIGASPENLIQKIRPEFETIKEAQMQLPKKFASQANPNITQIVPAEKKSKGALRVVLKIFGLIFVLVVLGMIYIYFFTPSIRKDAKFMRNFQDVSIADFEIKITGPVLAKTLPNTQDLNLLFLKTKVYIDSSLGGNKISSYEITTQGDKEKTYNILSTPSASYVYTADDDFEYKNQWIQVNGSFAQSFLGYFLEGDVLNITTSENIAVLPENLLSSMRQLWGQFDILNLTFEIEGEGIEGIKTRVYSFEINKEALNSYLQELSVLAKNSEAYSATINSLRTFLSTISVKDGKIWLTESGLPKRLVASVNTLGNANTSQISIEVNSYNQKKNISLPENFIKPQSSVSSATPSEKKKKSIEQEFLTLRDLAEKFKEAKSGNFSGLCGDLNSGFSNKFKNLEIFSQFSPAICKDSSSGYILSLEYDIGKYLCMDKVKIVESDKDTKIINDFTCQLSAESVAKDAYLKESINSFANIAKSYKTINGSFGGLCGSQNFMIFSRGLKSAIDVSAQCMSSSSAFVIFAPLSDGRYGCIDTNYKYEISDNQRTSISCK